MIIDNLTRNDLLASAGISKVEIAGPGFINITLETASQAADIVKIVSLGKNMVPVTYWWVKNKFRVC